MRTQELVRVLTGVVLLASLECGKSDHVHLKIHVPNVYHKHKHVKTKFVHVFHPKVIHTDHSSVEILHSRRDPNINVVNGGYPQTLIKMNKPELRITEAEFNKWRQNEMRKIWEQRKKDQKDDDEGDAHHDPADDVEDEDEIEPEDDDLYKKHKANKVNSSSSRKAASKHKNHNYYHNQEYEASNSDKSYANYPNRHANKRKPLKPTQAVRSRKNKQPRPYASYQQQQEPEASNLQPQVYQPDQPAIDPTYYATISKDQDIEPSNQDEIYSGLLSAKFDKKTVDKSKLLADLNYNRKKQTKAATAAAVAAQTKTNQ